LGWFFWRTQIKACLHAKNWRKATDFVELVYNSQLLQFIRKVSCGILMEDGAPMYCRKASKEWKKLCLIEKLDWPRVILSNVLGGKDVVEGRDGQTNGRVG
jgi:hypothetical protein